MAGTGMYGTIAKQLLQELRASDWLPAYNVQQPLCTPPQ